MEVHPVKVGCRGFVGMSSSHPTPSETAEPVALAEDEQPLLDPPSSQESRSYAVSLGVILQQLAASGEGE